MTWIFLPIVKDGNMIAIGADCSIPPELDAKLLTYSQDGYSLVDNGSEQSLALRDQQVINGAVESSKNVQTGAGDAGQTVEPVLAPVEGEQPAG